MRRMACTEFLRRRQGASEGTRGRRAEIVPRALWVFGVWSDRVRDLWLYLEALLIGYQFDNAFLIEALACMSDNNQIGTVLIRTQAAVAAHWLPCDQ